MILQPASLNCSNFTKELYGDPELSANMIIVPIKVKVDMLMDEAPMFTIAYACNLQERCYNYKCIYARIKAKKEKRDDVSAVAEL